MTLSITILTLALLLSLWFLALLWCDVMKTILGAWPAKVTMGGCMILESNAKAGEYLRKWKEENL